MKHIKLFEDYSDGELKDLMGDLETIGHKHRLVRGEDYGFGLDMDQENNGKNLMVLTDYAIGELIKGGIITENPNPYTKKEYIEFLQFIKSNILKFRIYTQSESHKKLLQIQTYSKNFNIIFKHYNLRHVCVNL